MKNARKAETVLQIARLTDIEVGGVQTYELNCECEWQAEKKGEWDD